MPNVSSTLPVPSLTHCAKWTTRKLPTSASLVQECTLSSLDTTGTSLNSSNLFYLVFPQVYFYGVNRAERDDVRLYPPRCYSPDNMGLLDPATSDGRVIFFLPWEKMTIAGTTDTPTEVTAHPIPMEDDINFILNEVRNYLSPDVEGNITLPIPSFEWF